MGTGRVAALAISPEFQWPNFVSLGKMLFSSGFISPGHGWLEAQKVNPFFSQFFMFHLDLCI